MRVLTIGLVVVLTVGGFTLYLSRRGGDSPSNAVAGDARPDPALELRQLQAELRTAVTEDRCVEAAGVAHRLRDALYYEQDAEGLDAATRSVMEALPGHPDCAAQALVQMALGHQLFAETARGDSLLRAGIASTSGGSRLLLERARALYLQEPAAVHRPGISERVPTSPEGEVWETAPAVLISRSDQVVEGGEWWSDAADASLEMRTLQFHDNFYLRIDVRDDQPFPEADAADEVVVLISLAGGAGTLVRRDPAAEIVPMRAILPSLPTDGPQEIPGVPRTWYDCSATEGGYRLFLCFPKNSIPGLVMETGNGYNFDILLHDRDAEGRTVLRAYGLTAKPSDMALGGLLIAS